MKTPHSCLQIGNLSCPDQINDALSLNTGLGKLAEMQQTSSNSKSLSGLHCQNQPPSNYPICGSLERREEREEEQSTGGA